MNDLINCLTEQDIQKADGMLDLILRKLHSWFPADMEFVDFSKMAIAGHIEEFNKIINNIAFLFNILKTSDEQSINSMWASLPDGEIKFIINQSFDKIADSIKKILDFYTKNTRLFFNNHLITFKNNTPKDINNIDVSKKIKNDILRLIKK